MAKTTRGGGMRLLLAALLPLLARAQVVQTQCQPTASGCTPACKIAQLANLSSLGGCGLTLTLSGTVSGTAPSTYGVNAGHAYPWAGGYADGSWIAFFQRLGGALHSKLVRAAASATHFPPSERGA
jgi:hypothetical protein